MRHQLNGYVMWELPFGRGKRWGNGANGFVNSLIGGWQISSVVRFNTGCRAMRSTVARGRPTGICRASDLRAPPGRPQFGLDNGPCPATHTTNSAKNEGASESNPNIFANPDEAIKSFRFSAMGERGQRNVLRGDSYASADMAFRKAFDMPYSAESQAGGPLGDLQSHQHAVLRHWLVEHEPRRSRHVRHVQRHAGRATAHAVSGGTSSRRPTRGYQGAASFGGRALFLSLGLSGWSG